MDARTTEQNRRANSSDFDARIRRRDNMTTKVLIVAPNWIGDTLLAQPLFARLHQRHAQLTLDALAPTWTAPVLRRMPEIASVIEAPFAHGELRLGARWRLARKLARRRYDSAVVLPNTLKAALIPFFAGIGERIGFVGESRFGLINRLHRLDAKALPRMAERYAQLAEASDTLPARPLPEVHLKADTVNRSQTIERLDLHLARPIAVLCPGAEYGPAKRWPVRHFATLARTLIARGHQVWMLGSRAERVLGEEIRVLAGRHCFNLCGKTDLASAIDLMSLAEIVVANDSGLMHVAGGLGRPLVALYGSSSPEHTPPLSSSARIAKISIECSPCYARECPLGHFRCMNDLLPRDVLALIKERQ